MVLLDCGFNTYNQCIVKVLNKNCKQALGADKSGKHLNLTSL
jgi:hypothetical protein